MRPVSVFANGPGSEIEQLEADLRGRWRQATRAVMARTSRERTALRMFERFTDQARRIVLLAQEAARMLNHDYIGTEHILLALIREDAGIAARALEALQIRRDKEAAIDAQDFENAAVLRDRERQLLSDKSAREREWAALPSLTDEVERLRDLLRRHGIDPQDGAA